MFRAPPRLRLFMFFTILLSLSALFLLPLVVYAQGDVTTPLPGGMDLFDVIKAAGVILVTAIVGMFGTSPVTVAIVGLIKKWGPSNWPAPTVSLIVAGILWLILSLARYFGFGLQFDNIYNLLVTILPPLAGYLGNVLAAPVVYELAHAHNVSILGYARDYGDRGTPAQRAQGLLGPKEDATRAQSLSMKQRAA